MQPDDPCGRVSLWPLRPMLATAGTLPDDPSQWAMEVKWDGIRTMVLIGPDGGVELRGRAGTDLGARFPELSEISLIAPGHQMILDGEVVTFTAGAPDFPRLQRRLHTDHPTPALIDAVPVTFLAFDLLQLDHQPLIDQPYQQRRTLLDTFGTCASPVLDVPPALCDLDPQAAADLLAATTARRLEGLVAKRLNSPYRPGLRSHDWTKIKPMQRRTVVVGGWKAGNGQRRELGALLIGVPEPQGLRYLGAVGSGFTTTQLRHLTRTLPRLHQEPCPFTPPPPPAVVRQARWVRPCLIGEVTYLHTTAAGHLRHPVWKGLIDGVYHLATGTGQSFPDTPQATVSAAPDPAGPHPTSKPG